MTRLFIVAVLFTAPLSADIIGYAGGAVIAGLYGIDPTSGTATFLTSAQSFLATGGLAYLNGAFYATNYTPNPGSVPPNTYGSVNIASGRFTAVGTQGSSGNWFGLATGPGAGTLYVAQLENNSLLSLTPGGPINFIGTITGVLNVGGIRGMAYDAAGGVMYATDYYEPVPHLYTVDVQTGAATLVGPLGLPPSVAGGHVPLAYDPDTRTLYAADDVTLSLYVLDVHTGAATLVGSRGSLGVPIGSMTWFPHQSNSIPEPSPLILAALVIAASSIAFHRQTRRRNL